MLASCDWLSGSSLLFFSPLPAPFPGPQSEYTQLQTAKCHLSSNQIRKVKTTEPPQLVQHLHEMVMLTNPSLFRPWFCTRHLWWSVGAPFLRFKKRTHHSAARGPGMVQSGNSSFCNSLLTSRHRRSSRMTPWNCRPSSRASAETSAPLYAGTSLCFIFRMARCSCATNLRPTDPRRTSDPSSSTASPLLFPPRVSTHVEPREPALQPQPLQGQQVEVPLLAPALLRRRELHLA